MSEREAQGGGFWTTLPGILTASAALITALTGLLLGLGQLGFFENDDGSPDKPKQSQTENITVLVDGRAPWTDTGVDVAAGGGVEVTARGEVFHNESSSIGPEGFPNHPDLLTPLPTANHAGLLARVGATGQPFYVGRVTTFLVPHAGRLFLGINDGGLENNRGFFTATITVGGG
ncbi:MAG: hypothetical protein M3O70_15105 [Actinomycetota bacterium]|nr:hypothetical protein [Actinomycetota bacterium]